MLDSIQQSKVSFDTLRVVAGNRLTKLLFGSYLGIVIAVLGGTMVMPELFLAYPHRGLSFWGNYFPAILPYSMGLLISVICLLSAAYIMPDYPERLGIMRRFLFAIAFGLAAVLLTPEQASVVFYWAHTLAAIYLFLITVIGSAWIMLHAGKTMFDWALFWMLAVGSMLSLLSASYVRILGVLALGQVLALTAGSLVVVRAALRWTAQEVKE